jgi:hypothetical protein
MTTFTFSSDHEDAADMSRDLAVFRRAIKRGQRLHVDIDTKREADAEIVKRVRTFADAKGIDPDKAYPQFFARTSNEPNSDDATLIAISCAGVLTMIGHPSLGDRS